MMDKQESMVEIPCRFGVAAPPGRRVAAVYVEASLSTDLAACSAINTQFG